MLQELTQSFDKSVCQKYLMELLKLNVFNKARLKKKLISKMHMPMTLLL